MTTGIVALDTTQYVRVNIGLNPMILQAHRDSVRVVFSEGKPAIGNTAFHLLGGEDPPYPIRMTDVNVWALSQTNTSSLIVTEFTDPSDSVIMTIDDLGDILSSQETILSMQQDQIIKQLRLINIRLEEAFETKIDEKDLN